MKNASGNALFTHASYYLEIDKVHQHCQSGQQFKNIITVINRHHINHFSAFDSVMPKILSNGSSGVGQLPQSKDWSL